MVDSRLAVLYDRGFEDLKLTEAKFRISVTLQKAKTFDVFFPKALLKRFQDRFGFKPELVQITKQFEPGKALVYEIVLNTKLVPKTSLPLFLNGMKANKSIDRYSIKEI